MNTTTVTVDVDGTGKSKKHAFSAAMGKVQQTVRDQISGTPIRIEPTNVEVMSARENQYKERFLGLLFTRTRSQFHIKIKVTAEVAAVDIDKIDFPVSTESLAPAQHLLQLR